MEEKSDFQIEGVFNLMEDIIVSGTVKSGTLRVGMKAVIDNQTAEVKGIESFRKMLPSAGPETKVGLKLSGINKTAIENRMNGIITFSGQAQTTSEIPSMQNQTGNPQKTAIIVALTVGILVAAGTAAVVALKFF